MAMAIPSPGFSLRSHLPKRPSFPFPNAATSFCFSCSLYSTNAGNRSRKLGRNVPFAVEKEFSKPAAANADDELELRETSQTNLYSTPLPMLFAAALPGAGPVSSSFAPFVELVKSWNLPEWLVHWGHPGNMAVVLFAMGGYGTYLGFRIRSSNNMEEKTLAKDLHPKLLGGMFFFFALGATGGITSLLTSGKPILESPHAVTGIIGLSLLAVQSILPSLFEGNVGLRNVHGILGSGIMTCSSSMLFLDSNPASVIISLPSFSNLWEQDFSKNKSTIFDNNMGSHGLEVILWKK